MNGRWVIGNAVTADGVSEPVTGGAVLVDGGRIARTGRDADLRRLAETEELPYEDAGGRLLIPGFLNAHTHLYSSLAAGFAPKGEVRRFTDVLERFWWPFDAALDPGGIRASASAGVMDAVAHGVTCIFDHHASMGAVDGSLDIVAEEIDRAGLRGVLCFETSCRRGESEALGHIEENLRFLRSSVSHPRIRGSFGLHANFTLSDSVLDAAASAKPHDTPIHVHCGEGPEDLRFCSEAGYGGPVDRLAKHGLLDGGGLLIHCIHLGPADRDTIERCGAVPVLNVESNLNNRVGTPDPGGLPGYVLGTDGMSEDMVASLRSHCLTLGADGETAAAFFERRYRLEERFLPGTRGLAAGCEADIAVLDYVPKAPVDDGNLLSHLVYGARTGKAFMTVCGGKMLYRAGTFTAMDEEREVRKIRTAAVSLWRRYHG